MSVVNRAVHGAVLLAAGRGRRLRPHTDTTPKPLLPVNGKPTLDLYSEALGAAGVSQVVLVCHHLAEQIEAYAQHMPAKFSLHSAAVLQPVLDGTASALEAVLESKALLAQKVLNAPFLLLATDYLLPPQFIADLVRFHASHTADVSVSIKRVPTAELASRSSVRFAAGCDGEPVLSRNILEVVEKPPPGTAPSEFSTNLAFVLPPQVLSHLPCVVASERGEREIQSAINAYLNSGGSARGLEQAAPAEWQPNLA